MPRFIPICTAIKMAAIFTPLLSNFRPVFLKRLQPDPTSTSGWACQGGSRHHSVDYSSIKVCFLCMVLELGKTRPPTWKSAIERSFNSEFRHRPCRVLWRWTSTSRRYNGGASTLNSPYRIFIYLFFSCGLFYKILRCNLRSLWICALWIGEIAVTGNGFSRWCPLVNETFLLYSFDVHVNPRGQPKPNCDYVTRSRDVSHPKSAENRTPSNIAAFPWFLRRFSSVAKSRKDKGFPLCHRIRNKGHFYGLG